jgi:hypothetical protein
MSQSNSASGGIGLGGFIFLIFLFLKLAGIGVVATWSWWWVTSPFWIPAGLVLGILLIIGIIWLTAAICKEIASRRPRKPLR